MRSCNIFLSLSLLGVCPKKMKSVPHRDISILGQVEFEMPIVPPRGDSQNTRAQLKKAEKRRVTVVYCLDA